MFKETIRVCEPDVTEHEANLVKKAVEENELSGHGNYVREFESRFAEYIGVKYCLLVPNGTIALHLALAAVGADRNSRVYIPAQTIASCLFTPLQLDCKVSIIDVNSADWCMDAVAVSRQIEKDKVIDIQAGVDIQNIVMPVHLYGIFNKSVIDAFVNSETIIIEDFSESIGTKYKGRKAGSFGDIGCCSFYANKLFTCGEGGAIVTDREDIYEWAKKLRDLAFGEGENKFWHVALGYNYRPNGIAAAMLCGQLDRVEELMQKRNNIHEWYSKYLDDTLFHGQFNDEDAGISWWMNTYMVPSAEIRSGLMKYLQENNVQTRPTFAPLNQQREILSCYDEQITAGTCPIANEVWERGIIFPSGGIKITEEVVKEICELANKYVDDQMKKGN